MSAPMHLEKHLKEPEPTGNHICVKIKLDDSLSKIQDFVQDVTQACAIEKTSFYLELIDKNRIFAQENRKRVSTPKKI